MRQFAAIAAVLLACVSDAQADVVLETVPIGNPGNPGEQSRLQDYGDTTYYGGVGYAYNIGKYEVTAGQYRDFLNAVDPMGSNPYGLYHSLMNSATTGCQITWNAGSSTYDFSGAPSGTDADWADRPVNSISWGDAARFANWMHNGQPTGQAGLSTTEDGSYFLNGATSSAALMLITREPDATWVIPSEDEWYKAAYHKNDGVTGNYFDYPTSSDSVPSNDLNGNGNNATVFIASGNDYTIGSPYYRTEFGAHVNSESPYDTFDQGGNVWEFNEAVIGSDRGLRSSSFSNTVNFLHAARRFSSSPLGGSTTVGFRVAEVPEPATLSLLTLGALLAARRRL